MRYFKDLLRVSLFVLVMYLPLTWLTFKDSLQSMNDRNNKEAISKMALVKESIADLLSQARILEACQRLQAERESKTVAMYYIHTPDAKCQYPSRLPVLPDSMKNGAPPRSFIIEGNIPLTFYRDQTLKADWAFAVPTPKNINALESITGDVDVREALFKEILLVIYIIFAFIFCAVLILAKSIQNQYRKKGKDPLWLKLINATFGKLQLHDMKIIKSATGILIRQNESLTKDKDLLETSLEYSILNEVKQNNHNIPYTFTGTVAKVDINGFSKVISAGDSVQSHNLTLFLEDFGCELLQRYNGLFEKTVGDEIIVIFKSEDSAQMATAFARDLMTEFGKLKFSIAGEQRSFTLKGAISSSALTFSKRAPGYGFHGDSLTYSSRLLDMVTEKDRNFLSCMKTEGEKIESLVQLPTESRKFEFKNMASAQGYLIDQFVPVEVAYETKPALLKYYRSDSAFIYLLEKIQEENNIKTIDQVINLLRQVKVRKCSHTLISEWIYALKTMETKGRLDYEFLVILSKLIMVGINLVPQSQWDDTCTQALLTINRQLDGRINASIVDCMMEKSLYAVTLENEASFIIKDDHSFRTRGNLLINQAYHHLDNSVFSKVLNMIESPNPLEVSTGLFCACSIILHYQKVNPAALETYAAYRKVTKILRKLQNDVTLSARLKDLIDSVITQIDRTERLAELS